ncbi:MAG: DinB family protein [Chloroflexi bacterium]|nr:DinB family protein [Chloroflexota bacterium]
MVSVPDDLKERVLSYIAHQSEKQPEGIAGVVEQGHDQLVGLLEGLSDEQAAFKASAEDWSVLEVLRHVVGSKRGVARRCSVLARGEASASFEPADEVGSFASLSEARAALDAGHRELLASVRAPTPDANVDVTFDHPFFGPLNCREWAVFQRVHDGDHAGQIEKIKAADGFPA